MIVKRCSCGKQYTLERWNALPLLGVQKDENEVPRYQARNCSCTSTIYLDIHSIHIVAEQDPLLGPVFRARRSDGSSLFMGAYSQSQLVDRIREFFREWDIYDPQGELL
jgi:hypothetical protein